MLALSLNAASHHYGVAILIITGNHEAAVAARERGQFVLMKPFTAVSFIQEVRTR
jgi:hypothetical protein